MPIIIGYFTHLLKLPGVVALSGSSHTPPVSTDTLGDASLTLQQQWFVHILHWDRLLPCGDIDWCESPVRPESQSSHSLWLCWDSRPPVSLSLSSLLCPGIPGESKYGWLNHNYR